MGKERRQMSYPSDALSIKTQAREEMIHLRRHTEDLSFATYPMTRTYLRIEAAGPYGRPSRLLLRQVCIIQSYMGFRG